jgi:Uma2 family endonuclease
MSTDTLLMTAEEYALLPDDGRLTELVRGEIVEMNQPTPRHGQVCGNVYFHLRLYVESAQSGHVVCNDTGILTGRNPDTIRGGDVWFISYAKVPAGPLPSKYLTIPPDLVFEVLSPGNSRAEILHKVSEYLAAGVPTVCILDPEEELAHIFYPRKGNVILKPNEQLTFPEILPGFSVPVHRLFE